MGTSVLPHADFSDKPKLLMCVNNEWEGSS